MILRLIPVVLSFIALGAHFLRGGNLTVAGICLILPLLLLARRSWSVRVVQAALVLGAAEWVRTLLALAEMRRAAGGPWLRTAVILGAVALVALVSAGLLEAKSLRERRPST